MKNRFISIKTKLILMLSAMAFITLSISTLTQFIYTIEEIEHENLKNLSKINDLMSSHIYSALKDKSLKKADIILNMLKENSSVDASFLTDKDKNVISSYIKNPSKEKEIKKILSTEFETDEVEQVLVDYIIVSNPLYINKEYIGSLSIFTSTKDIEESIEKQINLQIFIFIGVLLLSIIISLILQDIFTKPIINLKNKMLEVGETNDYTIKADYKTNDEYLTLFSEFNNMLNKIHTQDMELKSIHKYIQDSIEYASIIQRTIIPNNTNIKNFFEDSFIWWEPKDTVGGDIYLFEKINDDEAILMVIDCTGHGVHGAFVTMLVKAIQKECLTKIQLNSQEIDTSKILSYFNETMKTLLNQDKDETVSNAGFDGGILYINKKDNLLKYSSSQTPLFYMEDEKLNIIKGCRQSVGYKKSKLDYEYKEHTINYKKGLKIYLSTDGYFDQSGGNKGFCLSKKRFESVILDNYNLPMQIQGENFKKFLIEYQNKNNRNDDITLIGIEL